MSTTFVATANIFGEPLDELGGGRRKVVSVGDRLTLEDAKDLGLVDEDGRPHDDLEPSEGSRAQTDEPDGTGGVFPQHRGGGNWLLSNGSLFTGSKTEAYQAQERLDTARPFARDHDPDAPSGAHGEGETGHAGSQTTAGEPAVEPAGDQVVEQTFVEQLSAVRGVSDELAEKVADTVDRQDFTDGDRDDLVAQLVVIDGIGDATANAIVDAVGTGAGEPNASDEAEQG